MPSRIELETQGREWQEFIRIRSKYKIGNKPQTVIKRRKKTRLSPNQPD